MVILLHLGVRRAEDEAVEAFVVEEDVGGHLLLVDARIFLVTQLQVVDSQNHEIYMRSQVVKSYLPLLLYS